jgi:hypothetical protein
MRSTALVALVVPLLLAGSLVTAASADTPTTIYVSNGPGECAGAELGTPAHPFCDIQQAADVVLPGQTVVVGMHGGIFEGDVHITRSGTPDQPITFEAGLPWRGDAPQVNVGDMFGGNPVTNGFTLAGVHDVKIAGFNIRDTKSAGVVVSNSSDITIDHVAAIAQFNPFIPDDVDVTGASHNVTISRSQLSAAVDDISVGPGASGVTVAENIFVNGPTATSLSVNGASSTAITNNSSFVSQCPAGVFSVGGGSTGTVIENNIVSALCTTKPLVSVAADSTATTTLDYNIVETPNPDPLYSWAGTSYATPTALNAATGQGAHDLDVNPLLDGNTFGPKENSPSVDSANNAAPGVLATDFNGRPREDDPLVANGATGIVDRGAVERQDPMTIGISLSATQAPTGTPVTATIAATQGWAPISGYTVDFADGTPPVTTTATTLQHTFTTTSPFDDVTATVSDTLGFTSAPSAPVAIAIVPPAPLVPRVIARAFQPLHVDADATSSTDSWNITTQTCDFGDGSTPFTQSWGVCQHDYTTAGLHRVTVTLTDAGGNSATTSTLVQVGPGRQLPGAGQLSFPTQQCGACRAATVIHTAVTTTRIAVTHAIARQTATDEPVRRSCLPQVACPAAV